MLKTYAGFEATINLNGQLFYELKLSPLSDPFSLTTLKSKIKEYELTVESNKDFMTYIHNADRDHRIGIKGKNAGTYPIEFEDLLPGRGYTLCMYFENQHRAVSSIECASFTTFTWGSISKASLTFTK